MKRKIAILPLDGFDSMNDLLNFLREKLQTGRLREIVSHVKVNDAVYGEYGILIIKKIKDILHELDLDDVGIFLDLKLADTWGTNVNIIKKYINADLIPEILTIRSCCSVKTFTELRKLLPDTKLTIVSALTDMSEEECLIRYQKTATELIVQDIKALKRSVVATHNLFDAVVCSPQEVGELDNLFPEYEYIAPGIRDVWMKKGQQARSSGIRRALESGASLTVIGGQLTKGNPDNGVSVEQSIEWTIEEVGKAKIIVRDNIYQTLVNFDAVYKSPKDQRGLYKGPLVGYAGKDGNGDNYVGFLYYNMAQIEHYPKVLKFLARSLAADLKDKEVDVVLGAPMGGIALAQALSVELDCRFAFAEKKVVELAEPENNKKEKASMVIKRHNVGTGDKVLIVEDLCNNFSTTNQLKGQIELFNAEFVGIACLVNRSHPTINVWEDKPVYSTVELPTREFSQSDPFVKEHVEKGNVVWKAKHEWGGLRSAMEK